MLNTNALRRQTEDGSWIIIAFGSIKYLENIIQEYKNTEEYGVFEIVNFYSESNDIEIIDRFQDDSISWSKGEDDE